MSVGSWVVCGSGVGVFLHRCSRLKGSKGVGSCTLGSPTKLRDRGSSSELSSIGGRNSPCRHAIMAFLRSCVQRWSKGSLAKQNLSYNLVDLRNESRVSRPFVSFP